MAVKRKQTIDSQSQTEERYRTILEDIQEGYFEVDLSGSFTFVNEAECKLFGYPREEMMGLNYRQYLDEPTANKVFQVFNQVYKTGNPGTLSDYEIFKKNGTKATIDNSITLIRDSKGKKIGFGGVSRDVTERKRIEDDQRRSEEKYRTIIENIEDGYVEIDLKGNFIFFNDALLKIQGYPKEELMKLNYRDLMDEANAKLISGNYNKVFTTGESEKEVPYEIITKTGERRYLETSITPMRDAGGRIVAFRGIVRDRTERKQMEMALRKSEEKYRSMIETIQETYFESDLTGKLTYIDGAVEKQIGYSREELMGHTGRIYTDEETFEKISRAFAELYRTRAPIATVDEKIIRKDGSIGFYELSLSLITDSEGNPTGFSGISRDVTERKQMEEAIRESEERYRTIIEEMEEWYFETDLSGNILFFNNIFANAMGYPGNALAGTSFRSFITNEDADGVYRLFQQIYESGMPTINFPYEFIRSDGNKTYAELSIFPKQDREGTIIGFRGVGHDITERKKTEERIHYLATHDTLTGLPNRLMFSQLLNHALQSARRYKRQFAVLFIDLDRFKTINDTLGHEAGDQLLKEVATRLRTILRAVDIVARLGGDEFVVLIEEISEPDQAAIVARKVLSMVIKPVYLLGQECRITASVGISMYPKDAEDEKSLMKYADMAMYHAKEEGKNNSQFYSEDIKSHSYERLSLETSLRLAMERNELQLHYQAKLDFKTGAITGVEALLRWQSKELGPVTPAQFIPVAEETGMIVPIGRWVLRTACAQNVAWQNQGLPPVCMAVNLSLRQLLDDNLLEDIRAALESSGMAPHLLELEITESMVMHNPARMTAVLGKIKDIGVRLAVDDFGTGYSSLAQIRRFPVDTLKVDRSFIRNIPMNFEDKAITEAIIAMGKTLSLTVVAEGVETQEQMAFLQEHSCDEMQGYYFSKPVAPDKFADLLRGHVPVPQKGPETGKA